MKFSLPKPLRLALTLAAVALLIYVRAQITREMDVANSNFSFFWLAGRMVLDGQNPYDETQYLAGHDVNGMDWRPNNIFPYPLPLALLCVPLGLFSMRVAYVLWQIVTLLCVALIVCLLLNRWREESQRGLFLPLFFFLLVFSPTYLTTHAGTIGILPALFIVAAIFLLDKKQNFWAGFLLALTLLKPPQGATILALVGVWFLARRNWKALGGIAAGGLALLVVGWAQDPRWVQKFLGAGAAVMDRTEGVHSNVWAFAYLACGGASPCWKIVGAALSLILLGAAAWLLWKNQAQWSDWQAFNLIIPIAFLSAVYLWMYDQLPYIIPLTWIVATLTQKRRSVLPAFIFLIALDALAIVSIAQLALTRNDMWSLSATLLTLFGLWLATRAKEKPAIDKAPAPA
ncbi:MAG: DUF2029 domain-containing protein [Anaerolineales bacterium]|nr:DUF2029 domain-containing protein [Anaerolineales bacterium]